MNSLSMYRVLITRVDKISIERRYSFIIFILSVLNNKIMCRKKKVQIRKYEVAFISLCTKGEGEDYKTKSEGRPLDKLWKQA